MPRLLSLSCTLLGWISLYTFNFPHVMAQDLSVPDTWKDTTLQYSRNDTISMAQRAIARLIEQNSPQIVVNMDVVSKIVSEDDAIGKMSTTKPLHNGLDILGTIARKDYISGTKDNMGYVVAQLDKLNPVEMASWYRMDLLLAYGIASLDAYLAYRDTHHLDIAQKLWSFVSSSQITEQYVKQGKYFQVDLSKACATGSKLGGVFDRPFQDKNHIIAGVQNTVLSSQTTVQFMILSARLAMVIDKKDGVMKTALDAVTFVEGMHTSDEPGCLLAQIDLSEPSCVPLGPKAFNCGTDTLEGLFLVAHLTANDTLKQLALRDAAQLFHSSRLPENGILPWEFAFGRDNDPDAPDQSITFNENSTSTKFSVMNWLYEPWKLAINESHELAPLIQAFTRTQMNSMVKNAKNSDSSLYGEDWTNVPAVKFSVAGMTAAISALTAAIGPVEAVEAVASTTSTTTPTGSGAASGSSTTSTKTSTKGLSVGGVVGIAIGALVLLAAGAFGIWICLRRRQGDQPIRSRGQPVIPEEMNHSMGEMNYQTLSSAATLPTGHHLSTTSPEPRTLGLPQGATANNISSEKRLQMAANVPRSTQSIITPVMAPSGTKASARQASATSRGSGSPFASTLDDAHQSSSAPGANTDPEVETPSSDVEQLLRRADAAPSSAQSAELRQRLADLGPIPEVLQALQDLLASQGERDPQLPQYAEQAHR